MPVVPSGWATESVWGQLRECGDGIGIHFLTRVPRAIRPAVAPVRRHPCLLLWGYKDSQCYSNLQLKESLT